MDPVHAVEEALLNSAFVQSIRSAQAPVAPRMRALTHKEIDQLLRQGNLTTGEWSHLRVAEEFTPRRIWQNTFFGEVEIGVQTAEFDVNGITRKAGIYNSVIYDAKIEDNVFIKSVDGLSNYRVRTGAAVADCGSIQTTAGCTFFNGAVLDEIGVETGGRGVPVFAEITLALAAKIMRSRSDKRLLAGYAEAVMRYARAVTSGWGVIDRNARVLNTNKVHNVYLGEAAQINNAVLVENTTVLSSGEEPARISDGAYVKDAVIQWGAEISSMGVLTQSVMLEHSHIEFHGKVHQSILGANSGVAKGEITSSLVGPFVGFHHQSLLISAFWPEGKGNIAYGANVGSNHTSRAPDQEIFPGEGVFFGLGSSIKFPANYSKSPYSIIATNVITLPQRVEYPFSLINLPSVAVPGISPAFNEVLPAWVLSDNIFFIIRNAWKYQKRDKARREKCVFEIFRPDIMDLVTAARDRLAGVQQVKEYYADRDIAGLGKNFISEAARKEAVETYGFYLRYYALTGLFRQVLKQGKVDASLMSKASPDARFEHERSVYQHEMAGLSVREALQQYRAMDKQVADGVLECKRKDDIRGIRIIDDYAEAHTLAENEKFIRENFEETARRSARIEGWLKS
ncbi:MAG: DUF4954 family protein [Fibrobacterota bacterium]